MGGEGEAIMGCLVSAPQGWVKSTGTAFGQRHLLRSTVSAKAVSAKEVVSAKVSARAYLGRGGIGRGGGIGQGIGLGVSAEVYRLRRR